MRKRQLPTGSPTSPGGSKSRVNRAGENVRAGNPTAEDLAVIEEWRAAHRAVLNTFQAISRERARSAGAMVAQRHKRKRTIFDKLDRLPGMSLSRMDDVAGCRLIFKKSKDLHAFRQSFHGARFKHKRRHADDPGRYDYIENPKPTGYRGIHDIYEYDVNSEVGKALTGLYVEIQYRTLLQHAWATAVEVIGFITESQPKFQQGDTRYEHAMALASEILARAHENQRGPFPDLEDRDVVAQFLSAEKEIGLLEMLRGLNAADRAVSAKKNTILAQRRLTLPSSGRAFGTPLKSNVRRLPAKAHMSPKFWEYYLSIEADLAACSRFVEFTEANYATYSTEFARIIVAAAAEIDAILSELCGLIDPQAKAGTINQYYPIVCTQFPVFTQCGVEVRRSHLFLKPWRGWEKGQRAGSSLKCDTAHPVRCRSNATSLLAHHPV